MYPFFSPHPEVLLVFKISTSPFINFWIALNLLVSVSPIMLETTSYNSTPLGLLFLPFHELLKRCGDHANNLNQIIFFLLSSFYWTLNPTSMNVLIVHAWSLPQFLHPPPSHWHLLQMFQSLSRSLYLFHIKAQYHPNSL